MKTMNVIASNTEENVVPNRILIFSPQTAAILLNEKIGWGRFDFPRNKTEQGGWMIGHHITNGQGEIIKSEVQYILEAVYWSEDNRRLNQYQSLQSFCHQFEELTYGLRCRFL